MAASNKGRKLQLVFAGDMTYSMASVRDPLRVWMADNARSLQVDFPGVEIGAMFFGDRKNPSEVYDIKYVDLSANIGSVVSFIRSVPNACGGGPHANYELALHVAANKLSWDADARKIFLLFGDEVPHETGFRYPDGKSYDWLGELHELVGKGVTVCGVHCLPDVRPGSRKFYHEVARVGGGSYLTLPQFREVGNLLMAVAYQQLGVDHLRGFRDRLAQGHQLTRTIDHNIATLGKMDVSPQYAGARVDGLVPITGLLSLQALTKTKMVDLMRSQGIPEPHNVQRFYELTKAETIQGNKQIILEEVASGDMFTGTAARRLLNLPEDEFEDVRLRPAQFAALRGRYVIYVESQSNNRNIPAGDRILVNLGTRTVRRPRI